MFRKYSRRLFLGVFGLLAVAGLLRAGETGKIAGRVLDAKTGEPLPGANVIVSAYWSGDREVPLERPMGAATDVKGEFFIINVPPGSYTVKVRYIGYVEEKRTHVRVYLDKTTRLEFRLKMQTIQGQEVVVTAYKPTKVEVDLTATKQTYDVNEVQSIAGVADISDILDLQADVVDDHFRGGRIGESLYLVDGTSIVNPLNNERAFLPIVTGLEQVEVYTSGFSAEYGNVQSGVVNMVTKEGRAKWETRAEVSSALPYYKTWGGSLYSPKNLKFFHQLNNSEEWLKENPTNPGKPLWDLGYGITKYLPPRIVWPPNPLNHQDSLKMANIGRIAWLQSVRDVGLRYKSALDTRLDFSTGGPIARNTTMFVAARQQITHPIIPTPHPNREWQIIGNISHRSGENDRLKFNFTYDNQFENYVGSHFLWWTFDRTLSVPKIRSVSKQYGVDWQHIFSPATFMDIKLDVFKFLTQQRIELLRDGQFLYDYSQRRNWVDYTGPSFHRVGRVADDRGDQQTVTYSLNASLTSQVSKTHLLKSGLQLYLYKVDVDMDMNAVDQGSYRHVFFSNRPYEGALYAQDKMEFEGLIANIGLRLDFYDFNTDYYADIYSPLRNPDYDPTKPYLERGKYYDPEKALKAHTKPYVRLQPRIGISFPVSDVSVFHLNYGTFTQRPSFNDVYYNQVTRYNEIEVLGNPRLRPENTKAYDVGIVRGLPFGFYLDVSAYYKDVTDLVETAYYFDEQQTVYRTFRNRDYADIKGFHVNLEKRTGLIRGYVRYNYEAAKGKSSNGLDAPVTYFEKPPEGEPPVKLPDPEDIYLDYDRTHKAVFNLRFLAPRYFGPKILGFHPFGDLSVSATLRYMTGRPYTWDEKGLGLRFNKRTPDEKEFKARIEKHFRIGQNRFTLYWEGFNLLNEKIFNYSRTFQNERNVVLWEKDRKHIFDYRGSENSPYITNQEFYLLRNQPRHYRMGVIFYL